MSGVLALLRRWLVGGEMPSMYRRVIGRSDNGEIIHLECGHVFRLVIHERESFPCTECALLAHSAQDGKARRK